MPEQVRILEERLQNNLLPTGEVFQYVEITYEALGLPPRRISIEAKLDNLEERKKRIKEDLDRVRGLRPPTFDIS